MTDALEMSRVITRDALTALFVLDGVKGLGPQKIKAVHESGLTPAEVIADPLRLPIKGKRGDDFRRALETAQVLVPKCRQRAERQLEEIVKHQATILTYDHPLYPRVVYESNYPAPVLYARGAIEILKERRTVGCVGSRNIRSPYSLRHREFATFAAQADFTIVSGFALGADTIGHEAAHDAGGKTICVLPGGLERAFPPENRTLWDILLEDPHAVMVSETPFGVRASSLLLRKRNKLIVAFSQGVLVSQSSDKGGAMNAYRFALELHRPFATFSPDGTPDTSGNSLILSDAARPGAEFAAREGRLGNVATLARQAVLFDLDGTLWDSHPWYANLAATGDPKRRVSALRLLRDGRPAATVLREFGVSEHRFRELCESTCGSLRLYPAAEEALEALRLEGVPCAVVTNLPVWIAHPMLLSKGVLGFFEPIICYSRSRRPKPSPAPLLAATTELGIDLPSDAVWYIGDTVSDCLAAKASRMSFAWAAYGYGATEPDGTDVALSSLFEVLHL